MSWRAKARSAKGRVTDPPYFPNSIPCASGRSRERLIVLSPESTPGDADGDGRASVLDVSRFLKMYGSKSIDADANDDGVVDQRDLTRFLRDWSEGAG